MGEDTYLSPVSLMYITVLFAVVLCMRLLGMKASATAQVLQGIMKWRGLSTYRSSPHKFHSTGDSKQSSQQRRCVLSLREGSCSACVAEGAQGAVAQP